MAELFKTNSNLSEAAHTIGNQIHALRILIESVSDSENALKSWRGFYSELATQADRRKAVNVSDGR